MDNETVRSSPSRPPGSPRRILILASTFPAGDDDPVPSFVRDLVVATRRADPGLTFTVLAPHDPRSSTAGLTRRDDYDEYRFQYFWPRRAQVLAGRGGIVPSLQRNRALFLLVPFFVAAEWFAIRRLVRRLRPDLVNAHWLIPQGVVAAAAGLGRTPLVLTIHGGDVFTFDNTVIRAVKRFALRRSARVVVNSGATREKTAGLAPVETAVIPMGVAVEQFAAARSSAHTPLRILFAGRLSEEKGVADLLDAVAILRERGVPVDVRVAGVGPQEAALRARAAALGVDEVVEFLGWVSRSDIAAQYAWADVFAGPSITASSGWVEALGVVLIEAAASGLPVVTTTTGGTRDVVIDGETGYLVAERSPDQLAASLGLLAADPALRQRLGEAGRDHVGENFGWPAIARRYAALFRSVIEGAPD